MTQTMTDSAESARSYPLLPARILSLQRLILLLEAGAADGNHVRSTVVSEDEDRLSLLARLRGAHVRYALGSGGMERMGTGAWFADRRVGWANVRTRSRPSPTGGMGFLRS